MINYSRLAEAFVGLADTLVEDYDVVEHAQQLVDSSMELLPIAAAGILIGDVRGDLHVLASSSEQTRLLELLQVQAGSGPCLLAYRTGEQVLVDDLQVDQQRWPVFARGALGYSYRAVCALPLRLGGQRVGALNLFRSEVGTLAAADIAIGQALADVATAGILHQRLVTQSELINRQIQTALNTRITIEQAKGVIAERGHVEMEKAFALLRSYARRTRQRLADVAQSVIEGADTTQILSDA